MTIEEYRIKYWFDSQHSEDWHLKNFALIKCQEMQEQWKFDKQRYLKDEIRELPIPEIPPDLLTNQSNNNV